MRFGVRKRYLPGVIFITIPNQHRKREDELSPYKLVRDDAIGKTESRWLRKQVNGPAEG